MTYDPNDFALDYPGLTAFAYPAGYPELSQLIEEVKWHRAERRRFIDCINTKTAEFAAETLRSQELLQRAEIAEEDADRLAVYLVESHRLEVERFHHYIRVLDAHRDAVLGDLTNEG